MLPFPDWMPDFVGKAISVVTNTDTGIEYFWGYVAVPNADWLRFEAHLLTVSGTFRVVSNPIYPQYSPEHFEGNYTIVKITPPVEWLT